MIIRVKALTAEVEIQLPDKDFMIGYHTERLQLIIDKAKTSVMEIERELNSNNPKGETK
jgi:ribosomal protein S3